MMAAKMKWKDVYGPTYLYEYMGKETKKYLDKHSMEENKVVSFTDKVQFYVFFWPFPCGLEEYVSIVNSSPRPLWQNHLHPHLAAVQWNNHSHLCNLLEAQYM